MFSVLSSYHLAEHPVGFELAFTRSPVPVFHYTEPALLTLFVVAFISFLILLLFLFVGREPIAFSQPISKAT